MMMATKLGRHNTVVVTKLLTYKHAHDPIGYNRQAVNNHESPFVFLLDCFLRDRIIIVHQQENISRHKTRGLWTLALCLTPAAGVTNGNFLETYFIVTYGLAPLQDIRLRNLSDLDLTFQGHLRSYVMMSLESPYMLSY